MNPYNDVSKYPLHAAIGYYAPSPHDHTLFAETLNAGDHAMYAGTEIIAIGKQEGDELLFVDADTLTLFWLPWYVLVEEVPA